MVEVIEKDKEFISKEVAKRWEKQIAVIKLAKANYVGGDEDQWLS